MKIFGVFSIFNFEHFYGYEVVLSWLSVAYIIYIKNIYVFVYIYDLWLVSKVLMFILTRKVFRLITSLMNQSSFLFLSSWKKIIASLRVRNFKIYSFYKKKKNFDWDLWNPWIKLGRTDNMNFEFSSPWEKISIHHTLN